MSALFVEWMAVRDFRRAVVLLQADFVDKILSPPGTRDYRAVSAVSQISTAVKVVSKVGRMAFTPPPRVDSVLALIRPKLRMTASQVSMVKMLFSLRRRTVASAARELGLSIPDQKYNARRVYSLSPEEVCEVCPE